jgi:hypothetical protein
MPRVLLLSNVMAFPSMVELSPSNNAISPVPFGATPPVQLVEVPQLLSPSPVHDAEVAAETVDNGSAKMDANESNAA